MTASAPSVAKRSQPSIVVAVDGSPPSDRALEVAASIAVTWGARLVVLTVAPFPASMDTSVLAALRVVAVQEADRAREIGVKEVSSVTLNGLPVDEILAYVEKARPDMLVVGPQGASMARRALLGSVSRNLVEQAPCPVLVARTGPTAGTAA